MPFGSDQSLNIIIKARDEASAVLKSIERNTAALRGNFAQAADASRTFALGMGAAAVAAGGFLGYGVKVAADLQTAEIGLTTLLGSAEAAGKTVERIKREAARTPFELVGLTQATQLLASVTHDGDKALNVVLDIGEGLAAMGKGQAELDRIIVNLQQIASVGHASMVDIKQFAFSGIPIFEMLQQQAGLAGEALGKFIEDGGVTFQLLTQMFDQANDAGGRFFNAYESQSGSFNQSLSNLKDSFGIFLATVAQTTGVFELLTSALQGATTLLNGMSATIATSVQWLKEHQAVVYMVAGAITGALTPALIALATTIITVTIPAFVAAAVALAPLIIGGAIIGGIVAGALWIVKHWDLIKTKLTELKDWFASIWREIANEVETAAKRIMAVIQPVINAFSTAKSGASSMLSALTSSGGGGFVNPNASFNLPKFEMGGYVNAPRGTEVPAILHGGEYVLPAGSYSGGSNTTVIINNPTVRNDQDLHDMQRMIESYFRSVAMNHKFS